ncbi:MAG: MerR family transcriptional regulator [Clostridia bacterium]|nr:MerR family transcriptional regulator [Clostridia bacterium]
MRTVKEVAELTGISVRTLHWYDEIGLLRPSAHSEAGYRLYDDKAMERLQQILFFREFDVPLGTIRAVMDNPALDTQAIWRTQRQMLVQKAARLARQIEGIDGILKGENDMDFEVFKREDIEDFYRAQVACMTPEVERAIEERFGGMEGYHDYFMEQAAGEQAQREYQKMVEWYGGREEMREALLHPQGTDIMRAYGSRIDAAIQKLAAKRGEDVGTFAVKEIIGEYEFLLRRLLRFKNAKEILLRQAETLGKGGESAARIDKRFGEGTAAFMARAIGAFYGM